MPKRALITGITGQTGSYMADILVEKGYEVWGLVRRSSTLNTERINHIIGKIKLIHGDMIDYHSLAEAITTVRPDECYNFAGQSHVHVSWNQPEFTMDVNGTGVFRLIEAIRRYKPDTKFVTASSSEMFGKVQEIPQTETTPFYPRSPYGISKLTGHWLTINARETWGLFACSAIFFNKESERRGLEFVTRKITHAVAQIKKGKLDKLRLGNLNAVRDWGYSCEYAMGAYLMLQQDKPDDFLFATGKVYTVAEWLDYAFCHVGLDWHRYVIIDDNLKRPAEVDLLLGDASKAKRVLGWEPKVGFKEIIERMVNLDLMLAK